MDVNEAIHFPAVERLDKFSRLEKFVARKPVRAWRDSGMNIWPLLYQAKKMWCKVNMMMVMMIMLLMMMEMMMMMMVIMMMTMMMVMMVMMMVIDQVNRSSTGATEQE